MKIVIAQVSVVDTIKHETQIKGLQLYQNKSINKLNT